MNNKITSEVCQAVIVRFWDLFFEHRHLKSYKTEHQSNR